MAWECSMKRFALRSYVLLFLALFSFEGTLLAAVATAPAVGLTTGTSVLSAADIARMNAEATAAGSQFKNLSKVDQALAVTKGVVKVVTNPFTVLFSLVAPLGMFAYGFFEQAVASVKSTDYMGSTFSVMVNPKLQWDKLVKAEVAGLNKIIKPVSGAIKSGDVVAPSIKELQDSEWQKKYAGSAVGIKYDFGFSAAGDDPTKPLGFLRSATTGKYYYRPVRGQMSPASMGIDNKTYAVDFHKRPFDVLLPRLMTSLAGADIGGEMWKGVLNYTQLDSIKIFMLKAIFLLTTAVRNSFPKINPVVPVVASTSPPAATSSAAVVVPVITDVAQKRSSLMSSFGYVSRDKGASYPGVADIGVELSKLIHRLKVTPDIKRTVAANGGQTLPSKWEQSKIIYLGDVNPGLLLLSAMPSSLKDALNQMFKVDVNFYEYQAAIDRTRRAKLSEIQMLYDHVRSLGNDADDFEAVRNAVSQGAYIDGYMLKLAALQKLVTGINWKSGDQDFTDAMMLLFLMRRLLAEIYVGIESLVVTYREASSQEVLSSASLLDSVDDAGLQDQSVKTDVVLSSDGYNKNIDFDLLLNKVLKNRVAALKDYATFVKQYISEFVASNVGAGLIDRRYLNKFQTASDDMLNIQAGGPDDLSIYFPASSMKKTLGEFVAAVGSEAQKTLQKIDGDVASLTNLALKAQAADDAYQASVSSVGVINPGLARAKVAALDDLVVALRKKQSAAQAFGLYPVGYEEKLLKIVQLPGAVYLAYCLNYQMSLQSKAFEGDALYYFDDSFYDEDSSYLRLVALLLRAQSDLSRAASIVSGMSGPVDLVGVDGAKFTAPSGTKFYLDSLQKYDQYFLLQEQNMRAASDKFGVTSPEYLKAATACANADKLLSQKKRDMNNILRSFAFDRRRGVNYSPVNPIGAVVNSNFVSGISSAAGVNLSGVASLGSVSVQSGSSSVQPDAGVVGMLEDGTPVYSYERTVNGFLQAELARFAFRARMLHLDDLKELVFAVTGIKAEDLWVGVEAKKRQMLADQKAAAQAAKSSAAVVSAVAVASLDDALSAVGASEVTSDGGVVEESSSDSDLVASTQLLSQADLDRVVGRVSMAQVASSEYDIVAAEQSLAAMPIPTDGNKFTDQLGNIFMGSHSVRNPSSAVQNFFVGELQRFMGFLALSPGSAGISDINAVKNMLLVVTNLQNDVLASQSAVLQPMISQLTAFINGVSSQVGQIGGVGVSASGAAATFVPVASIINAAPVQNASSAQRAVAVSNSTGAVVVDSASSIIKVGDDVLPVNKPRVIASPLPAVSTATLLVPADLDALVAGARGLGLVSYNDAVGMQNLSTILSKIDSAFSVAALNKDGAGFTQSLKDLVREFARALNPSVDVLESFVTHLNAAMSVLAFDVGAQGLSDVNSFDNMLEVVTYLRNGILAGHGSQLSAMSDRLDGWLRAH